MTYARWALAASLLAVGAAPACAQSSPRRSQRAEMLQMLDSTEIRVRYVRPVARGRKLFGALVPYAKVWTPSADSALFVSFSRDVEVEGKPLKAGSYSVWTIPDSTQWTWIFNRTARAFHMTHTDSTDVLRVTTPVDSAAHIETLTLDFPIVDGRKAVMRVHWGPVSTSLRVEAK